MVSNNQEWKVRALSRTIGIAPALALKRPNACLGQ